jgi:hypothetical protein
MTRLRHARTWAIVAALLLVPVAPGFSQTLHRADNPWKGMTICFATYVITGNETMTASQLAKAADDLFHLAGQHVNIANDGASRGGVPEILGTTFNGFSSFQIAYLKRCDEIEGASSRLLEFLHRGTPRTRLPVDARVEFAATTGEARLVDNAVQFPAEEINQ